MFPLLDDRIFESHEIPGPTKQEIRAIVLSKMRIFPGCKILEIGTGTGSLTAEIERLGCYVVSIDIEDYIERAPGRRITSYSDYIQASSEYFNCRQSQFNSVFIGGTKHLEQSVRLSRDLLTIEGRLVVNAFTIESIGNIGHVIQKYFGSYNVLQVQISVGERRGDSTLMIARNPIFIFYTTKT
ncbi:precorrin-6B methylase [Metallosphaera tengchongensis]|uniref:Precorrin-6B methylase n=1 Tax=Metallosphaera tengchongensis TaxID=1532350 RepID=A0A6N0NX72_9CREN|nr:methyltransferase domain-containing protein [Metallosphaera tengchongensis]QKQ99700.1 precorrin-6B methylase [Metallosphaera tengchongensis]